MSVAIRGNPIPITDDRLVFILNQVCQCDGECGSPSGKESVMTGFELVHDEKQVSRQVASDQKTEQ